MARLDYAANNPYAVSVNEAPVADRVAFLRKVALLTLGGLILSGGVSLIAAAAVLLFPALGNTYVSGFLMLGGIFGARMIGGSMVNAESKATQAIGFVVGMGFQGVAMGYLILTAVLLSVAQFGNPFIFIGQAVVLVSLTVFGMVVYLLTGPKQLSMVGAMLSAVTMPMLALMVISFIFPLGGIMGIMLSGLFVVVSAGGLLYALNHVMHTMSVDMPMQGAFHITMGILTLFWNVLVLLMRLQRR